MRKLLDRTHDEEEQENGPAFLAATLFNHNHFLNNTQMIHNLIALDAKHLSFKWISKVGSCNVRVEDGKMYVTDYKVFGRSYNETNHAHVSAIKIIVVELAVCAEANKWTLHSY